MVIDWDDLKTWPIDELISMNRKLVEIIKDKQKERARRLKSKLRVGDRAEFTDGNGRVWKVTVEKVNTKTAACRTVEGGYAYKVPLSMLRVEAESAAHEEAKCAAESEEAYVPTTKSELVGTW